MIRSSKIKLWLLGVTLAAATQCTSQAGLSQFNIAYYTDYGEALTVQGVAHTTLATAFFILGTGPAREICAKRPELGAVLLTRGPKPQLEIVGSAAHEFRPNSNV